MSICSQEVGILRNEKIYIGGKVVKEQHDDMEKRKSRLCFNFKGSFSLPTKGLIARIALSLRHKAKENKHGLVDLYKDMQACAGYADIEAMWEMIHSSCPSSAGDTSSQRVSHGRFCLRPT